MRKPLALLMSLFLILSNVLSAVPPTTTRAAPPLPPTLTPTWLPEQRNLGESALHTPPSPEKLPPEVEQARAQQAIQVALDKYLRYWGPRYQVAPAQVTVQDGWAHGVAQWQSRLKTLTGPIHILAQRLPDGSWQAVLPESEGVYLQWVEAVPESLVTATQKGQLRAQAKEANALRPPPAVPAVPKLVTTPQAPVEQRIPVQPTPTPTAGGPVIMDRPQEVMFYTLYTDPDYDYQFQYPVNWQAKISGYTGYLRTVSFLDGGQEKLVVYISPRKPLDGIGLQSINTITATRLILPGGQNPPQEIVRFEKDDFSYQLQYFPVNDTSIFDTILKSFRTHNISLDPILLNIPSINVEILSTFPQCPGVTISGWPAYGNVIVPAGNWNGVDVYSNGGDINNACSSTYGYRYQCVELVQRFFATKWGYQPIWDIIYAYQMFDNNPAGTQAIANGGSPRPQWGDALVFSGGKAGHVAVVTQVQNDRVYFVEQNLGQSGQRSLAIDSNNNIESVSGYTVRGWVHASQNGGTCAAPSFSFPPYDSYISPNQTINFSWSGPTGCIFEGYTFRIKTVNTMDSGGDTYIDTGNSATYREQTVEANRTSLEGHAINWHNRDLYVGVRPANCSPDCSSSWAVRRFRIEPAPSCNPNADQVALYVDTNYGGQCVVKGIGEYPNPAAMGLPNDSLSSIRVGSNVRAILCKDDNYGGGCETLVGDDTDLGNNSVGNDQVSSVKVEAIPTVNDGIELCDSTYYGTPCRIFTAGRYDNLNDYGWYDRGESVRFRGNYVGNYHVVLHSEINMGGTPVHIEQDTPEVDSAVRNRTRSMEIYWIDRRPSAPTLQNPGNGVSINEGNSINLSWSATGDQYYGEIWGGPGGTLTFGWQNETSENIGSQWAGYVYSWRVKAQNSYGEGNWSDTWTFTVKPAVPTNVNASSDLCSRVNLSWSDNSGNEEGYKIYRNGALATQVGANVTSYQDTNLNQSTDYSYYVKAFRGSIESDASSVVVAHTPTCPPVDTESPVVTWTLPVSNTQVYPVGGQTVLLQVDATDNVGVTQVYFARWDAVNLQWVSIGNDDAAPYQSYLDTTTLNIGWNQVDAVAYDAAGNWDDKYIWLNRAEPQPDLQPYAFPGYPYPVTPSSVGGTHQVNTLFAGRTTYFDWHFVNRGDATAVGNFYVELQIDGVWYIRYPYSDYCAGCGGGFDDWMIDVLASGWHTLTLITDPDNTIAESDETNNVWQRQFYWAPSAPYSDNMENGLNEWIATGLWHQVDASSPYPASYSPTHSWWYGLDSTGTYSTGVANSGDLTSPPIYIPSAGQYLRFWYWYETETASPDWDQRWVQISVDGGPFTNVLQLYDDPMHLWIPSQAINLSGYAGHVIQIRFHFDTLDDYANALRGWYIDDLDISTTPPPTCADTHEPNDNPAQATTIIYNQVIAADICPGGDRDIYKFTGAAGDKVVVDIDARVNGSSLDSYIYLLSDDGSTILSANDDEYTSLDSHLGYQLPYNGVYYIKVRAYDHPFGGNPNYFYSIRLVTDTIAPSVAITFPVNSSYLISPTTAITVSATDTGSGVSHVEFFWHSADWQNSDWTWLGTDYNSSNGWNWGWDTHSLPDQYGGALHIQSFDWAGNYAYADVWNLGIDHTPPQTVTISTSAMYGNAPFRDFNVWWDGADNLSGIASYDVQYKDGTGGAWTDLTTGTLSTYFHFAGQNGHTYYFRARARDAAGNLGSYTDGAVSYTVQICATPPDAYEADNTSANAGWITTDALSQTHTIHAEGDQDWAKFYAAVGVTYTLVTTNTGGYADTMLFLYGTDGSTLLASNDDYPDLNWGSRIDWQPAASGIYYIMVKHWDSYAYGCVTQYGLTIATNDTTPPTGSITVNSGAAYATSVNVTLNLSTADGGTGVEKMMVAHASNFGGASWVTYTSAPAWTLTPGDDTKTVYIKFRDRAGNISPVYQDTIILDTIAPTGSILIEGGAPAVTDPQVVLTLTASDANGVAQMRLRNDAEGWSAWEPFATSRLWTLPDRSGEHTVGVQFRDSAGHVSATFSDSIVYEGASHRVYLPMVLRNVDPETVYAGFVASPTTGKSPLTVQFTDQSSGPIFGWAWNFGDGGTSWEQNPVHTYTNEGIYSVSLTVYGPRGNDTYIKTGYIVVVAQTPSLRVNDDTGTANQTEPRIAVDPAGNIYAVWRDERNGNQDIYFSRKTPSGAWSANTKVNDDVGTAYQELPDLKVDSAGDAYAIWNDGREDGYGDVFFSYRPAGGNWTANVRVNDFTWAGQNCASLAVDAAGNAYTAWNDWRATNDDIYFSTRPVNGQWTASLKISDDSGTADQSRPRIAVDASGNAYAVWHDMRNGNKDIYFSYRPVNGVWGTNVKVNDDVGSTDQQYPAIAIDTAGNAYVVWEDMRSGNQDIYFSQRSSTGTWSPNRRLNDDTETATQAMPQIAVDSAGNAHVVWQDNRLGDGHIFYTYRPAGGSWRANAQIDSAGTQHEWPSIAVDKNGNVYVIWSDNRNGDLDIYYTTFANTALATTGRSR